MPSTARFMLVLTAAELMAAVLMAAALTAAAYLPCKGDEPAVTTTGRIVVDAAKPIGIINPCIYGHFTEHIGGVIYDGIWVGPDSPIPNIHGIRKELVDYMRRISPPVIRWPGGCFADKYHWMDGIGPRSKRPVRYGRWSESTESNAFGTHEFMEFCKLVGAEPYLAGNLGTGTPEEFQSWVEYCNAPAGSTTLARLREKNGHKEPFNVRYWGVGNEAWGCGGSFTPEDYCAEYRKFSTWLPAFGTPLYLVASGPSGNDTTWTKRFFDHLYDYKSATVNGWSPHYYCGTAGTALQYTDDQWYELIARAEDVDRLIQDQWQALATHDPSHGIKLVIDEWGCWHPAGTEINKRHLFEQMSTLRDALVAAVTLDTFNRQCDKVAMANVAQLVNNLHSLFLADGPRFVATPNFYVFEMYRVHQGAESLPVRITGPQAQYQAGGEKTMPCLAGSASRTGNILHLSITNVDAHRPVEATIDLGGAVVTKARQTVLTARNIHAHNTFQSPREVVSTASDLAVSGGELKHVFPPASVTMLELTLR